MKARAALLLACASLAGRGDAFGPPHRPPAQSGRAPASPTSLWSTEVDRSPAPSATDTASSASATASDAGSDTDPLALAVARLKRVLYREYTSFFDPMVDSWYSPDVTFDDPLNSLSGVDAYRNNVDMLAGRTLLGKLLFEGAGINLHSVTGGEIVEGEDGRARIGDVVTRWTLRVTAKVLPWRPEAVFSGVSIYTLAPGGPEGVIIEGQADYWDSIDIAEGADPSVPQSQYRRTGKSIAVSDFLGQLQPDGLVAAAAAPELPFVLLRRGDGYEVRRYPGYVGAQTPYQRRDYGFGSLGAFAKGMDPLAPSIMTVYNDDDAEEARDKTMTWPLRFAEPGEGDNAPTPPSSAVEKAGEGQWKSITLSSAPEQVVAVRTFDDAATGPAVRNADRELRTMLRRDGLVPEKGSEDFVTFAQYDAVHSMGRRRGEAWIVLADGGHPF